MNQPAPIDPLLFRNALGTFATGVTVVTTKCESVGRVGLTANSFNSVSLDPPMVLWSLAKSSRALPFFTEAGRFCVNVLASDQVSISNLFASKSTDKFSAVDFSEGDMDLPVLDGCAASFECKTAFTYEGGDHVIFVGEVVRFVHEDRKGLLYHGGSYAVSEPHPVIKASSSGDREETGGFVYDYLDYLLSKSADQFERSFQPHLDKRGISRMEWRVLVTIADHGSISTEKLADIVLLEGAELDRLLQDMSTAQLIAKNGEAGTYRLLDKGKSEVTVLLAAAKAHESDVLGTFSLNDSTQLKSLLKRLI